MTTAADSSRTILVLPLARSTFDVGFAKEMLDAAIALLEQTGHRLLGPRSLVFDAAGARSACEDLSRTPADLILLLQVTFTDSGATVGIATDFDLPIALWAFPEPRAGGRLRLNSFCGLNLAAHALRLAGREYGYLYAAPDASAMQGIRELLAGGLREEPIEPITAVTDDEVAVARASELVSKLEGARIGRIGANPDGFETCTFDAASLLDLIGLEITDMPVTTLFDRARQVSEPDVAETRAAVARELRGLDEVDQPQLDRSLRLKNALDELREENGFDAFAIRCWPETFTEYGGAVCGPISMMGESRVPCSCEADVHGALTSLILQTLADAPSFQVDLVDLDAADDTGVVWHCGQAPISMADPQPVDGERALATIHTNRRMPLLYEFALKPGRVTLARISQAGGQLSLVVAGGEMLRRPKSYTGTSGVLRFDAGAKRMLQTVVGGGLEHHMSLVYGDFRTELRAIAAELGLPLLEIL